MWTSGSGQSSEWRARDDNFSYTPGSADVKIFVDSTFDRLNESLAPSRSGQSMSSWVGTMEEALQDSMRDVWDSLSNVTGVSEQMPVPGFKDHSDIMLNIDAAPYLRVDTNPDHHKPYFSSPTEFLAARIDRVSAGILLTRVALGQRGSRSTRDCHPHSCHQSITARLMARPSIRIRRLRRYVECTRRHGLGCQSTYAASSPNHQRQRYTRFRGSLCLWWATSPL